MLAENVRWSGARSVSAYARPALLRTFRDDVPDPQTQWALIDEIEQATEAINNARTGPEMDKALEAAGALFDRMPTR
jgi:hypothetical protein